MAEADLQVVPSAGRQTRWTTFTMHHVTRAESGLAMRIMQLDAFIAIATSPCWQQTLVATDRCSTRLPSAVTGCLLPNPCGSSPR
jgi:hypothetical protein